MKVVHTLQQHGTHFGITSNTLNTTLGITQTKAKQIRGLPHSADWDEVGRSQLNLIHMPCLNHTNTFRTQNRCRNHNKWESSTLHKTTRMHFGAKNNNNTLNTALQQHNSTTHTSIPKGIGQKSLKVAQKSHPCGCATDGCPNRLNNKFKNLGEQAYTTSASSRIFIRFIVSRSIQETIKEKWGSRSNCQEGKESKRSVSEVVHSLPEWSNNHK